MEVVVGMMMINTRFLSMGLSMPFPKNTGVFLLSKL
jgi:hypothetical protein